jgi:hypothetical protein
MLTSTQFYGNWRAKVPNILPERAGDFFKFQKRCQLFVGVHNETLPVAAMCVSNEDRSPFAIHGCDAAPTPTGFAEIISDSFPASLHGCFSSQSFWKAGSERKGSQSGSSLRRAGVIGVSRSQPMPGVRNNRVRVEIALLFSPNIV